MLPLILGSIAAAGGIFNAIGNIKKGSAAKNAAEYNADLAFKNAEDTLALGAEEERRVRVIARKQIGQSRANIGASGIQIDASALDVLQESAANAELDALGVRYQAFKKAEAFRADAALSRMGGAAARASSLFGAAGSILTGAGDSLGYFSGSGASRSSSSGSSLLNGSSVNASGSGRSFSNYA